MHLAMAPNHGGVHLRGGLHSSICHLPNLGCSAWEHACMHKNHGFIQPRDEFVERFEQAVDKTHGSHRHAYILSFCDGTFFYDKGIPTLTFGPRNMELGHSSNEYVDLNEVKETARTYAQAIENILGTKPF